MFLKSNFPFKVWPRKLSHAASKSQPLLPHIAIYEYMNNAWSDTDESTESSALGGQTVANLVAMPRNLVLSVRWAFTATSLSLVVSAPTELYPVSPVSTRTSVDQCHQHSCLYSWDVCCYWPAPPAYCVPHCFPHHRFEWVSWAWEELTSRGLTSLLPGETSPIPRLSRLPLKVIKVLIFHIATLFKAASGMLPLDFGDDRDIGLFKLLMIMNHPSCVLSEARCRWWQPACNLTNWRSSTNPFLFVSEVLQIRCP